MKLGAERDKWSVEAGERLVYGAIGDIGDGVFLPGRLHELAQELEARGYRCQRDDARVSLVSHF